MLMSEVFFFVIIFIAIQGGIKSTDEKKNGFIVNIFRFVAIVLLLGVIFIYGKEVAILQ